MIQQIIFYVFAAATILAAIGVIASRNPVYSALYLVMAFIASSGIWLLLEAEFLGIVLVLVYVGAVMVLFLFVVMMLDINTAVLRSGFARYAPLGAVIAILMLVEIGYAVWKKSLGTGFPAPTPKPADYSNTRALGNLIYTHYVYAFEIASVILLVGIIAAIMLTLRHSANVRRQNISAQVSVRKEDRVRLVKVPSKRKA